ncbi:MAG: LCP family protein [Bacilli bacterium]|nr:LCP family protein [Bacilli bacterium]
MKKILKRLKKKPILIFTSIFFCLFLMSSICLLYSILRVANIENTLRYLVSGILILLVMYFFFGMIKIIFKGKNAGIIMYDIIFILLFVITAYLTTTISGIYNSISRMYRDNYKYSVSLITLSKSDINDIKNFKDLKIAISNVENSSELNEVSNSIITENKLNESNTIVEYDNNTTMLNDLYNKKVDAVMLPSNYVSIYESIDDYKDIKEDTKEIISKSKTVKKENVTSKKNESEPFTLLIFGMDSTIKDISTVTSFNADSLILITFNPKTYNSTILSIPRDTYVPITCINNSPESKITHSGWRGESCVIKTIEDWMNIKVDYYLKVNFTAVVNLVDEIGGIKVNVPYSFCEQNSNRQWGANTVYVKKGEQTLNGEQALALARNRHPNPKCGAEWANYQSNDLVRGDNQQLILNAITNKLVKNLSIDKIRSILDIIGTNVDTNMHINEITSYYNTAKQLAFDNENIINFEKLQLSTYGKSLYDPLLNMNGMSMQIYYKDSFNQVVKEMKVNLGLEEPELITTFSFSINNPYKETIIGKGTFNQADIQTVPYFRGKNISELQYWANANGINLNITYQDTNEQLDNTIINQGVPSTYRMDKLDKSNTYTVIVARNISGTTENSSDINE